MRSIGFHLTISGFTSLTQLDSYADFLGLSTYQIFNGNPRGWKLSTMDAASSSMNPVVHGSYCLSLTDQRTEVVLPAMLESLQWCEERKLKYLVLHQGSMKLRKADAYRRIQNYLAPLQKQSVGTKILVENGYTEGDCSTGCIYRWIHKSGTGGIAWDTAHAWGAGWSLEKQVTFLEEVPPTVIHLNCPVGECGNGKGTHGWWHKRPEWRSHLQELLEISAPAPVILEVPVDGGDGSSSIDELEYVWEAMR